MALDIGIDLGTANIIITIAGKGIVLNEPSVVAYDKKKKAVVAVGAEAYKMIGRTPEYIVAVRPLKDGVISDNDMTEAMIREFIHMVNGGAMMKPRIVLCVPSSVTDVERRAVVEAAMSAGARKVFLIEEPIAALIGAGVDISKPNGTMVVDIGGGTADVAIVSFNGIAQSRSIKMAPYHPEIQNTHRRKDRRKSQNGDRKRIRPHRRKEDDDTRQKPPEGSPREH